MFPISKWDRKNFISECFDVKRRGYFFSISNIHKIRDTLLYIVFIIVLYFLGKCTITEITKCDGDAVVNNRKAKLIFFYEWVIEMKWEGNFFSVLFFLFT